MKPEYCEIAESLLGPIEWESPVLGYLKCPGEDQHTHPTRADHCRVTLDGVPTIYCFHSSCESVLVKANHDLRSACGKFDRDQNPDLANQPPRELTPEEIAARNKKLDMERLKARSKESLAAILKKWEMGPADFWEESPVVLSEWPEDDWKLLLALFRPDDVVWIGNKYDSCGDDEPEAKKAHFRKFFRPVGEWLKEPKAPNQFTCPSTFKPGTHSRCNAAVVMRKFLVVESDVLTKDEMSAVLNWCRQFMRLRAIVDTAGKSLHGWFEPPKPALIEDLRVMLPNLGRPEDADPTLDPALFKLAQPCRLPGAIRDGKHQALLYLDWEP